MQDLNKDMCELLVICLNITTIYKECFKSEAGCSGSAGKLQLIHAIVYAKGQPNFTFCLSVFLFFFLLFFNKGSLLRHKHT